MSSYLLEKRSGELLVPEVQEVRLFRAGQFSLLVMRSQSRLVLVEPHSNVPWKDPVTFRWTA